MQLELRDTPVASGHCGNSGPTQAAEPGAASEIELLVTGVAAIASAWLGIHN
jgi:hypothetical protein